MVGVGMIHQHQWKRRCSVFAETFCVTAICVSGWVPVTHWMNQVMVAAFLLCVWVLRVKECPHLVQRQRVVPLLVVPFFFVGSGECLMVCVRVPNPHKEMDQNDYCGTRECPIVCVRGLGLQVLRESVWVCHS